MLYVRKIPTKLKKSKYVLVSSFLSFIYSRVEVTTHLRRKEFCLLLSFFCLMTPLFTGNKLFFAGTESFSAVLVNVLLTEFYVKYNSLVVSILRTGMYFLSRSRSKNKCNA